MANMQKIYDIFRNEDRTIWKEKILPFIEEVKNDRCLIYETDDENCDTECCFLPDDLSPDKEFKFNVGDIVVGRIKNLFRFKIPIINKEIYYRRKVIYRITELPILDHRVFEQYKNDYFNDEDKNKFGLYICLEGSGYRVEGYRRKLIRFTKLENPNMFMVHNTEVNFRKAVLGDLRWKLIKRFVKKQG